MALHLALCICVYLLFTQGAQGNIDEYDCVDIYKQPAFQHPLLKNHKIQETFNLDGNIERSNKYSTQEHCPKGTVAILRQGNELQSVRLNSVEFYGQHYAAIETVLNGTIYRGAEAEISIHELLTLKNGQYSKSQIWLENGHAGQVNSIQAGWAVHPRLYGDSVTRLTIYWTRDHYQKTGCYNTQCPGFVVVSRKLILGKGFWGSSVYGQKSLTFRMQVIQDGFTGNWVLKFFDEVVGYWPKKLFTHLNKGASRITFGGNTYLSPSGISPPMGNGHFPVTDIKKTAYFKNIFLIDSKYKKVYLENRDTRLDAGTYNCYRVTYLNYLKSTGLAFAFGGPGGTCGF
ncbi:PREDICTED: uncharacterized protein LOC104792280 [Camelina sativa]|uniref:Uncharacterized protein LOC104792280 n=1 Tax=Camelina sativa TaxID=90675 RepID=A0ABM1RSV9_CAMSA|nr:PREDICTED: uncharacterized protein LOC104792280 [Camelina sativa]